MWRKSGDAQEFFPVVEKDEENLVSSGRMLGSGAYFFHEMKNIVMVLKGFVQVLAMNPKYEEEQSTFALMGREMDRLYQMVMDDWGLAPKQEAGLEWLDLGKMLEEVQALLKDMAFLRGVNIQLRVAPGAKIWGNRFHVRQMVMNLAKNGIEAMKSGGTLVLEAGWMQGHSILLVTDEGEGIPQEVCEGFGKQVRSEKPGGSGVGLSVCRQVLEECQARWRMEAGPNGSRIYVVFPREDEWTLEK